MGWTFVGDLRLSDPVTESRCFRKRRPNIPTRPDSWYLGVFAWAFIVAVIGYGTYTLLGPVRLVIRKVMSAWAKAVTPRKESGGFWRIFDRRFINKKRL